MSFCTAILALLLVLPAAVLSYRIDTSCTIKGVEGLVRDGMTNSFSMVDSALQLLDQDPYDQHTRDLIIHLFMPKHGQNTDDKNKMAKVRLIFYNIGKYFRVETTDQPDNNDIIIYCDSSRYEHRGRRDRLGRKIYYDTTTNTHLLYKEQSCHNGLSDIATLAVTYNAVWEGEELDQKSNKMIPVKRTVPAQIQLCPWFVDWIKDKKYKLGNDAARSNIGRFVVKKAEGNHFLTQIDAFSLLDKVLLHEMTHARMAFLGTKGTTDLPTPGLSFWPAYGWTRAKALAEQAPNVEGLGDWDLRAPDNNADSIALFGSACKLLNDPVQPRRVLADGRIANIPRQ